MGIDFSMSGLNMALIAGLALMLEGVCVLVLQNPLKNHKHFVVRDYIILGIALAAVIGGFVSLVIGIIQAIPFITA